MIKLMVFIFAGLNCLAPAAAATTGNLAEDFYGDEPTSYFEPNSLISKFNNRLGYAQYLNYSQRAIALVAGFDTDLHRYDHRQDLIDSFGRTLSYRDDLSRMRAHIDKREQRLLEKQNELTLIENEQNQFRCGQQLAYLEAEVGALMTNYTTHSQSRRLDLLNLIDSFGSPESELMMGNSAWLGSYAQCLESSFVMATGADQENSVHVPGRYCVASFSPPKDHKTTVVKIAVCLPQSCNSISILRHGQRIESLVKLIRLNQVPLSEFKLTNLYCLPDESSPLRQFSLSAKLFILALSSWLTIVAYFSLKYEYIRMNEFRFATTTTPAPTSSMMMMRKPQPLDSKLMRALAFRSSWSSMFSAPVTKPQQQHAEGKPDLPQIVAARSSNLVETLKDQMLIGSTKGNTNSVVCVVNNKRVSEARQPQEKRAIDLSVMDGIKVVSMIWLIMAHTLLFFIRSIANGRDFWSILRDPRYLTVMAGIFPVDTFFTVTGVLTAYLKFSKRDAIAKPNYWLEALVHRYLRFMPMYLIVFWFARDVSEYIGSGPLWDYSTASTSLRYVCKQESFSVPLLFGANFKPLDQHCVKPAWYLANDYQFLLVTPIFMMLLMRSARLGYSLIGLSIVASLLAQFLTVFYSQEVEDFGALVNFKPMFATYVLKNLWQLYVLPYNRIPPYLIGLLTGHLMYIKSQSPAEDGKTATSPKIDNKSDSKFHSQDSLNTATCGSSSASSDEDETRRTGSESNILKDRAADQQPSCTVADYLCVKVWTPLVCLISIIYFPLLTKLITQEGLAARIGTSSIIALMRFSWSLAIARLIYIAATRFLEGDHTKRADNFVVRFLASPMWKPWSKIGLSALLIQWEVIGYLAQTQTSVPDMTMIFLLATMLASILVTYLLAIFIYLTVEYPLSQIEQLYIIQALFRK